jgi:hypothetical protein
MNFFQNIIDGAKDRIAIAKEKKEFVAMVEEKAKPLRRKGYMTQILKDSIKEGAALGRAEGEKRLQKLEKKKEPADFGIGQPSKKDEWAFLDNIGMVEDAKSKSKGAKK